MLKKIILVSTIVLLSGCSDTLLINFEPSELSGVTNYKVGLITMERENIPQEHSLLIEYIQKNKELQSTLDSTCKPSSTENKVAAGFIPVIGALGKFAFDYSIDKYTKYTKKLKKSAVVSYSQRVILPSESFNQHTCGIIYRYDDKRKKIGFLSVIKLNNHGNAFDIEPVYAKAYNTAAITKKPKNGKEDVKINASIAVSVKATGKDKNNLPVLSSIGEGVVSISSITVGAKSKNACQNGCDRSDIIPVTTNSNDYISVTFSVTEKGDIGINLDENIAELEAIKEAIGPAISDGIVAQLEDDNE